MLSLASVSTWVTLLERACPVRRPVPGWSVPPGHGVAEIIATAAVAAAGDVEEAAGAAIGRRGPVEGRGIAGQRIDTGDDVRGLSWGC